MAKGLVDSMQHRAMDTEGRDGRGHKLWSFTNNMNMRDLSRDDDFLSYILVETFGTGSAPLLVHKMDPTRRMPQFDPGDVLSIVQKFLLQTKATPAKRIRAVVDALLLLPVVRSYIRQNSRSQINAFATHAARYLEIYLPSSTTEISHTSRYSHRTGKAELCILATQNFPVGTVIAELKGSMAALTDEENEELKRTDRRSSQGVRRDFSVIHSGHRKKNNLFLGPARFVNHDCDNNCDLIREGRYITFRVIKPIAAGQELTAHYGDSYFGKGNRHCLCESCEKKGKGGYRTELYTDSDHSSDSDVSVESNKDRPLIEGDKPYVLGAANERRTRRGVYRTISSSSDDSGEDEDGSSDSDKETGDILVEKLADRNSGKSPVKKEPFLTGSLFPHAFPISATSSSLFPLSPSRSVSASSSIVPTKPPVTRRRANKSGSLSLEESAPPSILAAGNLYNSQTPHLQTPTRDGPQLSKSPNAALATPPSETQDTVPNSSSRTQIAAPNQLAVETRKRMRRSCTQISPVQQLPTPAHTTSEESASPGPPRSGFSVSGRAGATVKLERRETELTSSTRKTRFAPRSLSPDATVATRSRVHEAHNKNGDRSFVHPAKDRTSRRQSGRHPPHCDKASVQTTSLQLSPSAALKRRGRPPNPPPTCTDCHSIIKLPNQLSSSTTTKRVSKCTRCTRHFTIFKALWPSRISISSISRITSTSEPLSGRQERSGKRALSTPGDCDTSPKRRRLLGFPIRKHDSSAPPHQSIIAGVQQGNRLEVERSDKVEARRQARYRSRKDLMAQRGPGRGSSIVEQEYTNVAVRDSEYRRLQRRRNFESASTTNQARLSSVLNRLNKNYAEFGLIGSWAGWRRGKAVAHKSVCMKRTPELLAARSWSLLDCYELPQSEEEYSSDNKKITQDQTTERSDETTFSVAFDGARAASPYWYAWRASQRSGALTTFGDYEASTSEAVESNTSDVIGSDMRRVIKTQYKSSIQLSKATRHGQKSQTSLSPSKPSNSRQMNPEASWINLTRLQRANPMDITDLDAAYYNANEDRMALNDDACLQSAMIQSAPPPFQAAWSFHEPLTLSTRNTLVREQCIQDNNGCIERWSLEGSCKYALVKELRHDMPATTPADLPPWYRESVVKESVDGQLDTVGIDGLQNMALNCSRPSTHPVSVLCASFHIASGSEESMLLKTAVWDGVESFDS